MKSTLAIETYADYLVSQGNAAVDLKGVRWMKYEGALIPAAAMPVHVALSKSEADHLIKQTHALFLRYTTKSDGNETNWWNMVCSKYDFSRVSSNTRSKIRRGKKRLEFRRVDPLWLAENGYACYKSSYERYKNANAESQNIYRKFMHSISNVPIFEVWGSFKDNKILGYIVCVVEKDGVFLHTIDISPPGLHDYAAYLMVHELLEHYVNKERLPVSNGARSIAHATNMQDFLLKFGFEREYAHLHIVYRTDVAFVVRLLYPIRAFLKRFENIALIHKITVVLYQEQIARQAMDPQISL